LNFKMKTSTFWRFMATSRWCLAGPAGGLLELLEAGLARYAEGWDGWCDQTLFLMMHVEQALGTAPGGERALGVLTRASEGGVTLIAGGWGHCLVRFCECWCK
jgi:hypothetical protein